VSKVHVVDIPHSPLGPSASERWLNCSGSVLLTKDMPNPDSRYAAEGNAAHTLSEWCRVQQVDASIFRGQILKVDNYEFEVNQEFIDGVNDFCEYVEQLPGIPMYEVRVHYDAWVPAGFGTMDDGRLGEKLAYVTDLKFGKGVQVWAEDNPQLKLYALGLYHDYRWLYEFDTFKLGVVQPRLNHIDEWEIRLPELLEWANDVVRPTAEIAMKPGAPLKAGDHCMFCPAKRVCKTRAKYLTEVVYGGDFENLDAPGNEALLLTNDEVARILP
jgi:hypothetical protein